jgi:hypothetical protein
MKYVFVVHDAYAIVAAVVSHKATIYFITPPMDEVKSWYSLHLYALPR